MGIKTNEAGQNDAKVKVEEQEIEITGVETMNKEREEKNTGVENTNDDSDNNKV